MPPNILVTPRSGQNELTNWFDQGPANLQLGLIGDQIVPQEDMLEFQQRRFWTREQVNLDTGEFVKFTLTVPNFEAWEIDHVTLLQTDTGSIEYHMVWNAPQSSPFEAMDLWRQFVKNGITTNIFPVRNMEGDNTGTTNFEYTGRIKLGPGEELIVTALDGTASVPTVTSALSIKGHRIPIPVEQTERSGLITSAVT